MQPTIGADKENLMTTRIVVAALALVVPASAWAHVKIQPVELVGTTATAGVTAAAAQTEAAKIEAWLKEYDAAFNAKDLEKLSSFYHPDVTVYEGGGINNGWPDYRDRHLGPELKTFQNLQFSHSNVSFHLLGDGQSGYVTATYTLKARSGERDVDSGGLATYILVKAADGTWKIRHSHTSSRARRPAA